MNYQEEAFQEFERLLPPKWFKALREKQGPLYPFVWGICGAMANLRESIEAAQQQAIPESSEGFWLSLHLLGLGLQRRSSETDAAAFRRYQFEFEQTRNTRSGLLRLIEERSGLTAPNIRIETDFAQGRYGVVRTVIDLEADWQEVDFSWAEQLLGQYFANGLNPTIDLRLNNLQLTPLLPFRFDTPFWAWHGHLGPLWERRSFIDRLRLEALSRNLIAKLPPERWTMFTLVSTERSAKKLVSRTSVYCCRRHLC